MSVAIQVWNPDEWEQFAFGLLQSRHGALSVHKVPAVHQGDMGIDYYCTTDQAAYQCYAVTEPVDVTTRAERQKKKITTDLGKLVANEAGLSKLLLGQKLKKWVLLSPLHDSKEVNLHCANKTLELRQKGCAHLADDFEVLIQDPAAFNAAAVGSGIASLSTVKLAVPEPTAHEVDTWSAGSADLLSTLERKLSKRTSEDAELQELVSATVRWFLEGNAILDALRATAPDLHERVMTAVSGRARRLKLAGHSSAAGPDIILRSELDGLVSAVKASAPNLSDLNADQIAFGTISEWIMRCPLDFPANDAA